MHYSFSPKAIMRYRYRLVLLLLIVLLLPQWVSAQVFFTARLTAAQQPQGVESDASGTAALALTEEGLRFFVTVNGLTGDIANAHFHQAPSGENGSVVRGIMADFTGTTASGLWTPDDTEPLTDDLIAELLAGNLYLNIHTADNPGGEIRGQVMPTSGTGLSASFTAAQQPGEVESDAAGTASVQLTDAGALFFVTVQGLSGDIANAHFHQAPAGVNGPVVRGIMADFTGNTAFGLWTPDDAEPLTDDLILDLLSGNLYLNIHTAANPGGEIRGQVLLTSGWGFSASLDPDQQPSGVTSTGSGTASLTLTDFGVVFRVTVQGLSGDIANAHFHQAPAGENGPVVRGIMADFTGTTASGLWTPDDGEPLTDDLILDLLSGNLYLNIHTAANPGGEIRGQVLLDAGATLAARLTPEQEGSGVTSDGQGTAALTLTDEGVAFEVSVDGLSGEIAAAHFHQGAAGVNGPPVRTITDDFAAKVVTLTPSKDNTLYESSTGALSNGAGIGIFAGRSNQSADSIRRGLVAFDIAGVIPAGSTIKSVELTMNMSMTQPGAQTVSLHRVATDWGEGTSEAAQGQGGGASATTDDATWLHSFFDTNTWTTPGGDFATDPSAEAQVEGLGTYTWASTEALVADVQAWLDGTSDNFGWLLLGNESAAQTAKRFDSRETENPPLLTVTYAGPAATASGLWTASDGEPLTDDLIAALLAGNLYLNIHTADNPGGEIRGQVLVSEGAGLRAFLTNEQQPGDVAQDASGTAVLTLTDAGMLFDVTVDGLSGDIANAHFHQAPAGVNGPVVRGIFDDLTGNTASGLWTASDAEPLTDALIQDLLTGNLYLNIHTAANPGGEIRGQVQLNGGIGMATQLDPGQQPGEVTSDGTGTAALTLTAAGVVYDLTVTGLSGDIANAHFHQAPRGQNGPVVRGIFDDLTGNTASGLWTASDAEPLTDALIQDLLTGNLYLNIHTAANPGGEIRGQVRAGGVISTAIEVVDAEVPEGFRLSQNYPNPFNPATTIEFSMDRSTHAVLSVYNALGQRVAMLVEDTLPAGRYRVTFDAGTLPSGVYFYQFEAGGQRLTEHMILLK